MVVLCSLPVDASQPDRPTFWEDCPPVQVAVFATGIESSEDELTLLIGIENRGTCATFMVPTLEFARTDFWKGPVVSVTAADETGKSVPVGIRFTALGHPTRVRTETADLRPIPPGQGILVRVSMCDVWRISFPTAGTYQVCARVEIPAPNWTAAAPTHDSQDLPEWAPYVAAGVFESQPVTFHVSEEMARACAKD